MPIPDPGSPEARIDAGSGDREGSEQRDSRRNSAAGDSSGSGSASGVSAPRASSVDSGINSPLSANNGFTGDHEFNPFKKQDEKEVGRRLRGSCPDAASALISSVDFCVDVVRWRRRPCPRIRDPSFVSALRALVAGG